MIEPGANVRNWVVEVAYEGDPTPFGPYTMAAAARVRPRIERWVEKQGEASEWTVSLRRIHQWTARDET